MRKIVFFRITDSWAPDPTVDQNMTRTALAELGPDRTTTAKAYVGLAFLSRTRFLNSSGPDPVREFINRAPVLNGFGRHLVGPGCSCTVCFGDPDSWL